MMNIKISVIVPVYNVLNYIEVCVKSMTDQSYSALEILLVDDGSTDGSSKTCDELASTDTRIKVIHKKNGGSSDARNVGILSATGDYIVFIDSDDYWDDNKALEHMVHQLKESDADVLVFGYKKWHEQEERMENVTKQGMRDCIVYKDKITAFDYMMGKNIYISSACSKLIKRDLFKRCDLIFEKNVTSEDIEWSARLAIITNSFDYYEKNIYIYVQRAGSKTKNMNVQSVMTLMRNIKACVTLGESIIETKFYPVYMGYTAYQYITLLANSLKLEKCDRQEIEKWLRANVHVMRFGKSKKVKLIYFLCRFVGFKLAYVLLSFFLKRKRGAVA